MTKTYGYDIDCECGRAFKQLEHRNEHLASKSGRLGHRRCICGHLKTAHYTVFGDDFDSDTKHCARCISDEATHKFKELG